MKSECAKPQSNWVIPYGTVPNWRKSKNSYQGVKENKSLNGISSSEKVKHRHKVKRYQLLLTEMQKIREEHPNNDNYGVERMKIALEQKGIHCYRSTVLRTMRMGNSALFPHLYDREPFAKSS